jgi:hypothetical protein
VERGKIMKTLYDYLSKDNQDKLVGCALAKGVPLGQIKVQESYDLAKGYHSINPVGATRTKHTLTINGKEYSFRKRIDYIARRVDIQLHHNFKAGIAE